MADEAWAVTMVCPHGVPTTVTAGVWRYADGHTNISWDVPVCDHPDTLEGEGKVYTAEELSLE